MKARDFAPGERHGRLTAVRSGPIGPYAKRGIRRTWFVCDCGVAVLRPNRDVRSGNTKSCGCLFLELQRAKLTKHGGKHTAEWRVWTRIRQSCGNPRHRDYRLYGARGITVDPSWSTFPAFLADVGPKPTPQHSLDRINNDGPYAPGNVRWATSAQQSRNTGRTKLLTYRGRTQCIADWAKELGLEQRLVAWRIRKGWVAEAALLPPNATRSKRDA